MSSIDTYKGDVDAIIETLLKDKAKPGKLVNLDLRDIK